MTKHKHADLIHAYAEGAEIQKFDGAEWWDDFFPGFFPNVKYRIKYNIKPRTATKVGWLNIYRQPSIEYPAVLCCVHPTEKVAKQMASVDVIATVKVEWEEKE